MSVDEVTYFASVSSTVNFSLTSSISSGKVGIDIVAESEPAGIITFRGDGI